MQDQANLHGEILDLLKGHKTLKIATAGGELSPWIAGAFYAEKDAFTLQLVMETHGSSLRNILANDRVAVMVASESPFAMFAQGEGRAVVVEGEEATRGRDALLAKNPEMEPFFKFPLRHVRIDIARWRLTDVPRGWIPAKELRASNT